MSETYSAMPGPTLLIDTQQPENSRLFGCTPDSTLHVNDVTVFGDGTMLGLPVTDPADGPWVTADACDVLLSSASNIGPSALAVAPYNFAADGSEDTVE